jgi:hypothetical protein
MTQEEQFEALKDKLHHIGMMGQWYQRYNITTSAEEAKRLINDIEKRIYEPCDMSRKQVE